MERIPGSPYSFHMLPADNVEKAMLLRMNHCLFWGIAVVLTAMPVLAGDWPEILGPHRNGIAEEEQLASRWPRGGPPELWQRPVGEGSAGLSIVGDRAMLFHRIGNQEVLEALDLRTGSTLYADASPTTFESRTGSANGPSCVPVIAGDVVISCGAQGLLTCVDFQTGQRLWQRETHRDFLAPGELSVAGSTPVVVDGLVIVNVGGVRAGAGIVAFSLKTGETVWKQSSEPASNSAPVTVEIDGQMLVMMVTRFHCQLFDPATGVILFQFPFGPRGTAMIGASPVVMQDRLLVTAAYGAGTIYGEFDLFGFRTIYQGAGPIATQYCTPIFRDGFLYYIDGRDDVPPADLKCVELAALHSKTRTSDQPQSRAKTTALKWVEQNFGYGTLLLADEKLIALKTSGELLLIRPAPDALQMISRCRPLKGTVRALPALSQGRLLIRNEQTLKCLNLGR